MQPIASAQSQFANLSGSVRDASGAVVVGASVSVKDAASAETRKTVTNEDGFFGLSTLPASKYEVVVEMKGFQRWRGTDIVLNGADSRTMNIELKVGMTTETVTVTANATQIAQVDSGEKSWTIQSVDLQKLSLVGRNATEFLKIMPGAIMSANGGLNRPSDSGEVVQMNASVASSAGGGLSNVNINGSNVDITQDGQHVSDPGSTNLVPINPNPDMISEVKVLTSNFTAENAKGPVVMNSTTKGGGSDFHGAAYLYTRNSDLNSTEHNNLTLPAGVNKKPPSSFYYPGGNLGGPVLIPGTGFNRSRKKVFFFDGFEYYKQQLDGGVEKAFVPTSDMLNGDFSKASTYFPTNNNGRSILYATPKAPAAGAWAGFDTRANAGCTITGGVLSSACISPGAQILLKDETPTANVDPTTNGGFNYIQTYSVPQNSWQNVVRGDYNISDNTKVYVSWSRQRETNNWPLGLWAGTCNWCVPSPTGVIGANGSDFVSGTFMHVFSPTMTLEGRLGYMKENLPNTPTNPKKINRADVGYPLHGIYSDTNVPAVLSWGDSTPNYGDVGHDYHPSMVAIKGIPSTSVNLMKVLRTHTTKYGFYYEHLYNKQDNWQQYMGVFQYATWAGTATGNQYADMLMGVGQAGFFQQGSPQVLELAQNIAAGYAQDDWKLTRRLTVQYGLRFEHYAKPYSPGFGLAQFDPLAYFLNPNAVNPGVSWNKINSNIPLSGSDSRTLFFSPRLGAAFDLFGTGKTVVRGGWGKYRAYDSVQSRSYTDPAGTALGIVSWGCGTNDPLCPTWEAVDTHAYTPVLGNPILQGTSFTALDKNNDEQPLVDSYSLTIDQQLPARFKLELSYVGNHGQFLQGTANVNSIPLGALNNAETAHPTECFAGGKDTRSSTACQLLYRPFTKYQAVTEAVTAGKSRFDSLQTSLVRYYGFLTVQLNYTFSKTLGEGNGFNLSNGAYTGALPDFGTKWLYGVSALNRAHAFSAAYVFSIPNSKRGNALLRGAVNDWQISGITQIQSGVQLTAQSSNFNYSGPLGALQALGTPDIPLYPLITCNPTHGLKANQYLNPNCFAPAPTGALGTAGMPYMPGPKFWNTDLSLFKGFKITERQGLQFRFAAFNPLNHGLPSFVNGDSNLKLNFPAGSNVTNNASTFGVTTAQFGQRKLEFGLKYTF